MKKILNKIKLTSFLILISFFHITISYSDQLMKIEIYGNERLAKETVKLFTNLEIGDDINTNIINDTFKNLFETNYFQDLKLKRIP